MYNRDILSEIRELLSELEEIALQRNMKLRVRDTIQHLQIVFQKELTLSEFESGLKELEELLLYICKTEGLALYNNELQGTVIIENENENQDVVFLYQNMQKRVEQMLCQCERDNRALREQFISAQGTYVRQAETEMNEMSNANVKIVEIMDSAAFNRGFLEIGYRLDRHLAEAMKEYVNHMCDTYVSCIRKINSMLRQLPRADGYIDVNMRGSYQLLDSNAENIRQEYIAKVQKCDVGASAMGKFVNDNMEKVTSIINKNVRKRKLCKLLPVFLVLFVVFASWGMCMIERIVENNSVTTAQEITSKEDNGFMVGVRENIVDKATEKLIDKLAEKGLGKIGKVVLSFLGLYILPLVVLIVAVPLALLFRYANRECERRIKKEVTLYLTEKAYEFVSGSQFSLYITEECTKYELEINCRYMQLIGNSFRSAELKDAKEIYEDERLQQIMEKWLLIKKRV